MAGSCLLTLHHFRSPLKESAREDAEDSSIDRLHSKQRRGLPTAPQEIRLHGGMEAHRVSFKNDIAEEVRIRKANVYSRKRL